MKHTRKIGLFALLAGASILPSVLVDDAALSAKAAIKGRTIYYTGGYKSGRSSSSWGADASYNPPGRYSRSTSTVRNGLLAGIYGTNAIVNLDHLTVNQALPEPPVVQLNISESTDNPGKTKVRWHID